MRKLAPEKRAQILTLLCEGMSMRAISRTVDVSINTVTKLLIDAGEAAIAFHDDAVRDVHAKRIQCDEIWSFNYAKQKNVAKAKNAPDFAGDVWTWTALDSDSKMIVSYLVGGRDGEYAMAFMDDLRSRLANRVQLSTDGHRSYLTAVDAAFGADIDYGMLNKIYGEGPRTHARYSPAICIGAKREVITGNPKMKDVSTLHVERSDLSMRMHMRRFTRLTNGHSKRFANHCHMVALYTLWYNFVRVHSSVKMSPAMAAGVSDTLWSMADIVALIEDAEGPAKKRGPYKPRTTPQSA